MLELKMTKFSWIESRRAEEATRILRAAALAVIVAVSAAGLSAAPAQALNLDNITSLTVLDKEFTNWFRSSDPLSVAQAQAVKISKLEADSLNPGIKFDPIPDGTLSSGALMGSESSLMFSFGFDVAVTDPAKMIKDISITNNATCTPGGYVEYQFSALGNPFVPQTFTFLGDCSGTATKMVSFTPVSVLDDLTFTVKLSAPPGINPTFLNAWDLNFSQTPEPGSAALFAANFGLVGCLLRRRSQRKR